MSSIDPRYPVGRFAPPSEFTPALRARFIDEIAAAPRHLRDAVAGLSPEQLRTPYREGGWTVAQVVHHVPDSHLNSYTRFKLALTEDDPQVKGYDENGWARLPDGADASTVGTSLALLEALHDRWVRLLRALTAEDFARTFRHPDRGSIPLDLNLAIYAWHGRHHAAHVTALREAKGW
jgi:uncharacterized damage-inducible protein DinB